MPRYECETCKQVFTRKLDYNKHKKTPCVNNEVDDNIIIGNDDKAILTNIFKACLNILRDNEAITGTKALQNISYFIILRLIEPQIDSEYINYNYDFSDYVYYDDEEQTLKLKKVLLHNLKFSNLVNEKDEDIPKILSDIWYYILSQHPKTKSLYLQSKTFDLKHMSTYRRLINKLNSYDISKSGYDVLGNVYESVIQDIMTGKSLGQFFTMPIIKNFMINLIDPQIKDDGTIESIADPAAGTNGFLITSVRHIMNKAKNNPNIKLNWDYIINEGIYSKEIDLDTYQLGMANMLISTGNIFTKLENGDSIRQPILRKFDIVIANPPYGIKTLKYDEFNYPEKMQYIPIKTGNAVSLFLQAIIYMLKIEGRAAIVLPDGKDLFSKSEKVLVSIREYLMKTCDLKEVIYLPSGIFTYTSIKTCILYFVKKIDNPFIIEEVKKPRGKITEIRKFVDDLKTTEVSFYDFIPSDSSKKLLITVPIQKIKENLYSLRYLDYIEKVSDIKFDYTIQLIKLEELCEIKSGNHSTKKDDFIFGEYPIIGGGTKPLGYHNTYNCDENVILCASHGSAGYISMYNKKTFITMAFSIIPNNKVTNKYLYYYLKYIENNIIMLGKGSAQPCISMDKLKKIEIPVPCIELQNYIVEFLDRIYEQSNKSLKENIKSLRKISEDYLKGRVKGYGNKTLGELCEFLPKSKRQASYGNPEGKYPFFKSSNKLDSYVDEPDYNKESIIIGDGGDANINYGILFSSSDHCYILQQKQDNNIMLKYLYYYISCNLNILQEKYIGAAIKNISKENIKSLEIPIPPIQVQNEIVKTLDADYIGINTLKDIIKNNKQKAKEFLDSNLSHKDIIIS